MLKDWQTTLDNIVIFKSKTTVVIENVETNLSIQSKRLCIYKDGNHVMLKFCRENQGHIHSFQIVKG